VYIGIVTCLLYLIAMISHLDDYHIACTTSSVKDINPYLKGTDSLTATATGHCHHYHHCCSARGKPLGIRGTTPYPYPLAYPHPAGEYGFADG